MQVFDLRQSSGNFETKSEGFTPGTRSFGIWSFRTPEPGDLIVIQRPNNNVIYIIDDVRLDFTGSDGNKWWKGTMRDVIFLSLVSDKIVQTLKQAGCA